MKRIIPLTAVLILLAPFNAWAEPEKPECEWKSHTQLNITSQGTVESTKEARSRIDKAAKDIENIVNGIKPDTFEMTSQNYSINSQNQNYGTMFRYNATLSYQVEPAEKASDILAAVTEAGMRGNLNSRKYRDHSCLNRR